MNFGVSVCPTAEHWNVIAGARLVAQCAGIGMGQPGALKHLTVILVFLLFVVLFFVILSVN